MIYIVGPVEQNKHNSYFIQDVNLTTCFKWHILENMCHSGMANVSNDAHIINEIDKIYYFAFFTAKIHL